LQCIAFIPIAFVASVVQVLTFISYRSGFSNVASCQFVFDVLQRIIGTHCQFCEVINK